MVGLVGGGSVINGAYPVWFYRVMDLLEEEGLGCDNPASLSLLQAPRAVWIERIWMKGLAARLVRANHYLVRVGHPETGDTYEVEQEGKEEGKNKKMTINGSYLKSI